MVQVYKTPFAAQGDKDLIPVPTQGDGSVSVTQGFGYDYEREYEDPAAKDIRREIMNGILHDITEALGQMQQLGFAAWQNIDGGWPIGANVSHGGGVWQSLANANTEEPGTGPLWKPITFDTIGQSTELNLGLVRLATLAQAQAMTADDVVLTPKKLADAFKGANQILSGNGMQRLPGGFIIQSLFVTNNNGLGTGYSRHTWPQAFPNGVLALSNSVLTGSPSFNLHHVNYSNTTTTHLDWVVYGSGGSPTSAAVQVNFIALGY